MPAVATSQPVPTDHLIIGLGQIGTSVGLALMAARSVAPDSIGRVLGYDPDPVAAKLSASRGAVDQVLDSPVTAALSAGMVILAAPAAAIPALVAELAPHIAPATIVTDVGSAKELIVAAMDAHLGQHGNYAGGHPMAGREQPGPAAACPDMFNGRTWVVCPGPRSSTAAINGVQALARHTRAVPVVMSAAAHDRQVAWTSHLPYLTAVALALTVDRHLTTAVPTTEPILAGGSLRDGTRVAASDSTMAGDYCWLNRHNLQEALARLQEHLAAMQAQLAATAPEASWHHSLAKAQAWRTAAAAQGGLLLWQHRR